MSKVIVLANHKPGLLTSHYLLNRQEDEVLGIYLSEESEAIDTNIKTVAKAKKCPVYSFKMLNEASHKKFLLEEGVDFLLSIYWPHFISSQVRQLADKGTINFHPSLLPLNKGCYPHLFNLLEETPAGVSLHQLTEELDSGPLWAQRSVAVTPFDTAQSLYERLQLEIVGLFKEVWPQISSGKITAKAQQSEGSYHAQGEIKAFNEIDLDKQYSGRELINLLRARSLDNLGFAYYQEAGERVYVNLRTSKTEQFGD